MKDVVLKTLVVTFNDDTTAAGVREVARYLLNYHGSVVFTFEDSTEVIAVEEKTENDA